MRGRLQSGSDFDENRSNVSRGFDDNYMEVGSPAFNGSNFGGNKKVKLKVKRDHSGFKIDLQEKLTDNLETGNDDNYDQMSDELDDLYHQKARIILKQAIPSVFCMLISMLQEIINLIFVGHLNNAEMMAGVGMGNMIQNMLGLSFFIGLNGALETLCSQAYGNGELKLCGIYLNRGRFVLCVSMLPIFVVLSHSESILVAIGQNPETARFAQEYIFAYLPGLFIAGLFDGHRRFLNSLGRSQDPLVFQVVGILLHIGWCKYFVTMKGLGIVGIGYASTISNMTVYVSLLIYSSCIPEIAAAIQIPDRKSIHGIGQYLSLGIPSAMMLCLEWWAYEVMTLMAGYLGVEEQAAQIVLMNIVAFMFMFALGLSTAACTTVGQQVGRGEIKKAKQYYHISRHIAFLIIVSAVTCLLTYRDSVIGLFTNIEGVKSKCFEVLIYAAIGTFPDLWQGFLQGTVKALGIQSRVISLNFIAYWVINLPMCYFLVFELKIGYKGIWFSIVTAQFFLAVCFHIMIEITDWQQVGEESQERQKAELEMCRKLSAAGKNKEIESPEWVEQN